MAAGEGAKPGFQGRLNLPEGTGEPWRALEDTYFTQGLSSMARLLEEAIAV